MPLPPECGGAQVRNTRESLLPSLASSEGWSNAGGFGADPVPLERCLDLYAPRGEGSPLCANNLWTCPRCRLAVSALQAAVIVHPPEVLTIVLKRFQQHGHAPFLSSSLSGLHGSWNGGGLDDGGSAKVVTPVSFGLELCLDPWVLETLSVPGQQAASASTSSASPRFVYELFAVVHHSGTLRGGHYTAHARHPISGRWYHYNDSSVEPSLPGDDEGVAVAAPLEAVLSSPAAYVLLYRRRSGTAADEDARRESEARALTSLLQQQNASAAAALWG